MNDQARRTYSGALPWPQTAGAHHGLFQASSAKKKNNNQLQQEIKTIQKIKKKKKKVKQTFPPQTGCETAYKLYSINELEMLSGHETIKCDQPKKPLCPATLCVEGCSELGLPR